MTVPEIQGHLAELYGLEVSPDLISTITDAILETVAERRNRPLEATAPASERFIGSEGEPAAGKAL